MKAFLLGLLFLFTAGVLLLAGWIGYEKAKDPLTLVEADVPSAYLIKEEPIPCEPGRLCRAVTLGLEGFDPIELSLSLPEALPRGGIPVVILLGGFDTGKRSIYEVPKPGANAVIGYDYPLKKEDWYEASWPRRLLAARKASRQVPAQVLALLRWARAQGWSQDKRVSLLGFSLGALYLPAAHHMARLHHQPLGPSIIAYGGAGLEPIFRFAFREQPAWLGDMLTGLAVLGLRELEPAHHLPHLKGEFLLLNGSDDRLMPMETIERLRALTPDPKTVVTLPSDHMMPGDRELMEAIIRISRQWLLERKAINADTPDEAVPPEG